MYEQVSDSVYYITIDDGNSGINGTADINMQSTSFIQSTFASVWTAAFNHLDPINRKLDYSDTVEPLFIVGENETETVDDFADPYIR